MSLEACSTSVVESVCNGVFGEFLQGVGLNNEAFLITSPVNIYSKAVFTLDSESQGIQVKSPNKYKVQQLANRVVEKYQLTVGGSLSLETYFPVGKGLGSSSADLVAAARALNLAYNLNWSECDIEEMIRGIEPTDGVMYSGIVSYYHKRVKLNKVLGSMKGVYIVGIDEGGKIDTVEYNQIERDYSQKEKERYDQLHLIAEKAVRENNIALMGRVSTESSLLNQRFNRKVLLEEFLAIKESLKIPGIIVAHSGTYIGFLLDKEQVKFSRTLVELKRILNLSGYHQHESFHIC